jgi:hypothetical protein
MTKEEIHKIAINALKSEDKLKKIRNEILQLLDTHGHISLYNKAIHDVLIIVDREISDAESEK